MSDPEAQSKPLVYLSYAPQDQEVAVTLCRALSDLGLDCFPYPENREPETFEWNPSSAATIRHCDYFALIHSTAADALSTVQKEVRAAEQAPRRGWMLLDRAEPQPVFRFRMGTVNACLAFDGDLQENIAKFATSIRERLQNRPDASERSKPQVFISYSRPDGKAVDLLCKELAECHVTYFRDTETLDIGSEAWERRTVQAIRDCSYFVVVHSAAANRSDWVAREISYAQRVRRSWIRLDNTEPDPIFEFHLGGEPTLAFTGDRDTKIREFARSISRALSPTEKDAFPVGLLKHHQNPYLGHRSFEDADSGRLLGRDSEIGTITTAVYESVHPGPHGSQPTNKRFFFVYGPSGTGKSSLITAGVLPALRGRFKVIGPLRPRELERTLAGYAAEAEQQPCIIALDQFEEIWPDYDKSMSKDVSDKLGDINTLLRSHRNLVVMVSFREEYLAKVQRSYENERAHWNPQVVRGLTESVARDCIRGPANDIGVDYADDVLNALARSLLTDEDQLNKDGDRVAYVEPVELQLVCRELWDNLPEGISTIHTSHLCAALKSMLQKMDAAEFKSLQIDESDLDAIAKVFVTRAIEGFLTGEIAKISQTSAAKECRYDQIDRINFALLQFISDTNKRVHLKIHWEGNTQWVGRLPVAIVYELERQHLLRVMYVRGEYEFELMHDRLVAPISSKREHLGLLYSVNSLDSAMTKVKNDRKTSSGSLPSAVKPGEDEREEENPFQGWFESYEPLIKDLDSFKEFEGLKAEEAEFILRSALACSKDKEDELKEWAQTVARQHPGLLAVVLRDAFAESQTNATVRMNAAVLLRQEWLQTALQPSGLSEMLLKVYESCGHANKRLDTKASQAQAASQSGPSGQNGRQAKTQRSFDDPNAELEQLCHTLAICPANQTPTQSPCEHLKALDFNQNGRSRKSRRILLWMRDKVNMRQPSCFVRYWNTLSDFRRGVLTLQLFWLRMVHTGFRILCISIVGAIVTGIGAGTTYAVCASYGASFTQNTSAKGLAQGLLHGFAGGIIWGFALSLSTLIYWLILRGRRVEPNLRSHWLGGIMFSCLSGTIGGFFIALTVVGVDDAPGLRTAGWLTPLFYQNHPYYDAFHNTSAGFIFPIYGLFLGLGVGWSMLSLHHDSEIKKLMSNERNTERTTLMFGTWARTVLKKALWKSGPYAVGMVLAGIAMLFLFHARYMDCVPKQSQTPVRCESYSNNLSDLEKDLTPVASLELRALGTSLIIYIGALSLTVGYLLALLAIRFGIEIPEDKNFAPLGETFIPQKAISFAEDPQPAPVPRQTVPG